MTDGTRPDFSVVIPAHNEEAVLARCLDALLEGTRPGQIEIVVAVNGSRDRTREIAESYGPPVIVVEVEQASKHIALNAGDDRVSARLRRRRHRHEQRRDRRGGAGDA